MRTTRAALPSDQTRLRQPPDRGGAHGTRRDRREPERAVRGARAEAHHRADRSWIDSHGGYDSDAELIAFAKKMKARQYARMLEFEDEEIGTADQAALELSDHEPGRRRYYADILRPARRPAPAS